MFIPYNEFINGGSLMCFEGTTLQCSISKLRLTKGCMTANFY